MAMIKVTNLTKRFGKITAIDNVSFEVREGEILGFLGPNGAGKSTTMRILTGFFPPTAGEVEVCGLSVDKHLMDIKRRIGYLPENVPLYYDMRVTDFLNFVGRAKNIKSVERRKHIERVIDECALQNVSHRIIGKLSKGYKQRVGIAQALMGDPAILILDEPTIGLDPQQIIEIRQLIKKMAGQKTVILSTHILPEVSMISDRVIIINEGRIVAIDSPDNLNTKIAHAREILVTISGDEKKACDIIRALPNVLSVEVVKRAAETIDILVRSEKEADVRGALATALVEAQVQLRELKAVALTLEDIFLKLVTNEEEVDV